MCVAQETEILELRAELARVRAEARRDTLTGLGNRAVLGEIDAPEAYVMCDLDGFKVAQDNHPDGHLKGDAILVQFAEELRRITRPGDTLVRYAGDEFVVALHRDNDAGPLVKRVQALKLDCGVTVSAGSGSTLDEADRAMYSRKSSRRKEARYV